MLHVEPITSLSVHMGFMDPRAFVISAVATWTRGWGFRKRDRTREEENSGRSSISTPIPPFPTPTRAFTRILDFQRDFQPRSILNLERSFTHRLFPERRFCSSEKAGGFESPVSCFFSPLNDESVSLRARTFFPWTD